MDSLYFGNYSPWSVNSASKEDQYAPRFGREIRVTGVGRSPTMHYPWQMNLRSISLLTPKPGVVDPRRLGAKSLSSDTWDIIKINMTDDVASASQPNQGIPVKLDCCRICTL